MVWHKVTVRQLARLQHLKEAFSMIDQKVSVRNDKLVEITLPCFDVQLGTKTWQNQIYAGEWRIGREYGKGTYSHQITGEYKNMFFYREDACNSGKQLNDQQDAFFKDDATPMTAVNAFWQEDYVSAIPSKSGTRTQD